MANGAKLLERMRANPSDWRLENVEAVCAAFRAPCTPPRKGSHYKVKHDSQREMLTDPAHRPIKPFYIEALVRFVDAEQIGTWEDRRPCRANRSRPLVHRSRPPSG